MKKTDFFNEVKSLDLKALNEKTLELKEELMKLRFRNVSGQLEQSHQISAIKKNIARVETLISDKRNNG